MQLPNHGANPHRLYEKLDMTMPTVVYDFSENVNALGLPKQIKDKWPQLLQQVMAYPDPYGEPFLSSAARFHRLPKEFLLIGNGASEIFSLLAERYRGKRALIVQPTFSEYEATLEAKEAEVQHILMSEATGFSLPICEIKEAMYGANVLYLCTPNNPTGLLPSRETLAELIEHGEKVECDVVLDEAFIDFVDESLSFIPNVKQYSRLLVVRSMTKMYAIPGIRLGYLVSNPSIIEEMRSFAPQWNVSGIAAEVGALCFEAQTFVEKTKEHNRRERDKMHTFLEEHNCVVLHTVTNYIVFKLPSRLEASMFYQDLLAGGLVLRHTENFRGMNGHWFRIGIKTTEEMVYLRKELERWFAEH